MTSPTGILDSMKKFPITFWLIHSATTSENFNRLRFVPMVQILAALQPKFSHSVINLLILLSATNFMDVYNISFQIIYGLFFFRTRNSSWMSTSTPFSKSKCFKICPALPGTVPKYINERIEITVCIVLVILLI